ncbi:hypothetical protein GmRootV35_12880 [Variovorax sp. V35]
MVRPVGVPRRTRMAVAAVLVLSPLVALAQQSSTTPQPFVEQQRQQECECALREQNERTVDQRPQAAPAAPTQRILESESPCFRIDRVLLVGEQSEAFQWAIADLSGPNGNDSPLLSDRTAKTSFGFNLNASF